MHISYMDLIPAIIIGGFAVASAFAMRDYYKEEEYGVVVGQAVLFIVLSITTLYFVKGVFYKYDQSRYKVIFKKNIEGIRSGMEVHGSGSLFTFVVQSSDGYVGWVKKKGGLQKFSMPQNSIIYQDQNVSVGYYIILQKQMYVEYAIKDPQWEDIRGEIHEIHVPKGTVKLDFNIK